jgi:Protein of unknown function (DUF4446)
MLENINLCFYSIGGLALLILIWNIFLQINLGRVKKNQKILFRGSKGKDLEKVIIENQKTISELKQDSGDLYKITSKVHALASKGLHKTGLVRFNPFRDIGGDQSFSLALLDGDDNGIVISSLYSRDGVRVYSKSINNKQSVKYPLSEEEKQAILIASTNKNNQKNKRNL